MSRFPYPEPKRPLPWGDILLPAVQLPPQEKPHVPAVTPDSELSLLAQRLETKYAAAADKGGLGRGPTGTFVDPLGASRWRRDYFWNRDNGDSPDVAWGKVNAEINRIVGLPTGADPNRPVTPPPTPGTIAGPLSVSGRDFEVPNV